MNDFTKWSYDKHREPDGDDIPSVVLGMDTVDTWLHTRLHETLLPLVNGYRDSEWLTIGDGRFGSDANFLIRQGVTKVVATDLSDEKLKEANRRGFIGEFSAENAEKLSFADESFDFVLCKETYHHLPRPPVAFYEMLRVSRIGVALIEPIESDPKPLDKLRGLVKRTLRGNENFLYEVKGNFLYRATLREIEKMMSALNLAAVAFKRMNTLYMGRSMTSSDRLNRAFTRAGIFAQDALCRLALMNWGVACAICFKRPPENPVLDLLRRGGFEIKRLPRNPYA